MTFGEALRKSIQLVIAFLFVSCAHEGVSNKLSFIDSDQLNSAKPREIRIVNYPTPPFLVIHHSPYRLRSRGLGRLFGPIEDPDAEMRGKDVPVDVWIGDPTIIVRDRFVNVWQEEIKIQKGSVSKLRGNQIFKAANPPPGVMLLEFETLEWGLARESNGLFHLHLIALARLMHSDKSMMQWSGRCYQATEAIPRSEWITEDGKHFKIMMDKILTSCAEDLLSQFFGRPLTVSGL